MDDVSRPSSGDGTVVSQEPQQTGPQSPKATIAKAEEQIDHIDNTLEAALKEHHGYISHRDENGKYIVEATGDDKRNPRNWPKWKRYGVVGLASFLNNMTTLCVSGYSTGTAGLTEEFGVSDEIGTLGLSLFILGLAIGEKCWEPQEHSWP